MPIWGAELKVLENSDGFIQYQYGVKVVQKTILTKLGGGGGGKRY